MAFETKIVVRFGDVDAAGIVFYPRYFEMLNNAIEDWSAEVLGIDFGTMHLAQDMGMPIVDIRASFSVASILSDILTVRVTPLRIGKSSCVLRADFTCNGETRLFMEATIVCMRLSSRRSFPWAPEVRAKIEAGIRTEE
jgi:4-hydroxybenzoyl-CoA thioesterase